MKEQEEEEVEEDEVVVEETNNDHGAREDGESIDVSAEDHMLGRSWLGLSCLAVRRSSTRTRSSFWLHGMV